MQSISTSTSNSYNNSDSSSSSGDTYSQDALGRISQLYPMLFRSYRRLNNVTPYAQMLGETGGSPMNFGNAPQFPGITTGDIWNSQQIQDRVNASRAQNDLGLAGATRRLGEQAAARGYGGNSPLLQELQGNLIGQNMAANTQAENDLRWSAAQGNAAHRLDSQRAAAGVAQQQEAAQLARMQGTSQDELARRQMGLSRLGTELQFRANRQNALLQALWQYNQPLPYSSSTSKSRGGSSQHSESRSDSNDGLF